MKCDSAVLKIESFGAAFSNTSDTEKICRFCFCGEEQYGKLVSPCLCRGSVEFVHYTCLRRWQSQKLYNPFLVTHCGVCRAKYHTPPPYPSAVYHALATVKYLFSSVWRFSRIVTILLQTQLVLALLFLFAIALSLFCLPPIMLCSWAAVVFAWTVCMTRNSASRPIDPLLYSNMSFERYRITASQMGLRPGVLLVSLPSILEGPFARSAVVLLEHAPGLDTVGVIINKPLQGNTLDDGSTRHVDGGPCGGHLTKTLYGKPSGDLSLALHLEPNVNDPLYESDVIYLAAEEPQQECGHAVPSMADDDRLAVTPEAVVCHGFVRWSPGQLEGEIYMGLWGWMQADKQEVFCPSRSVEQMWDRLLRSPYLHLRSL